jgi:hypothetical protein
MNTIEDTIKAIDAMAASLLLTEYASSRPDLIELYERAKSKQWSAADLPWETPYPARGLFVDERMLSLYGTPYYQAMSPVRRAEYNRLETAWVLSQFMHGEQTSMLVCGQLMAALPELDAKFYAASQGYDEARHTEVYRRYVGERLGLVYEIDEQLRFLCDTALKAPDWAMKLVANQVVIESLALGAFKTLFEAAQDTLLAELLARVMQDEARHIAFGRLALERALVECDEPTRARYEDFLATCTQMMYYGFFPAAVFRDLGLDDVPQLRAYVNASEQRRRFRSNLFPQLIPSARSIGLITDRTIGRYRALGIDVA